ncbi:MULTISPECIES: class I SAM-dependent methyltransferase [Pseudomonas]|jgi:SAM-dependent methyltransferase|uniref:class I SAM-dependent methyltransferase n=1 Tax=Pseudomonas TaxID=286 RepID=UPI0005BBCC47|nr:MULTISPECIES: class I SAM-dependent methyltransferase [Pseudomonas]WAB91638.1 class I SAM-dependent methyltransferase [Pseudomonas citronellolis]
MTAIQDQEWLDTLKRSMVEPVDGLPGWPSSETQSIFVGASGEKALDEAFRFYEVIRDSVSSLSAETRVLDFGVGWGRIIRCFYKNVPEQNLHGVDVDPAILEEAKRTGVKGNLKQISNNGCLPFSRSSMDVIYAFSVFSHLSEDSAKHWITELMRVLKPGGTLIFTSTNLAFLNLCRACKEKIEDRNLYEERYANLFDDPSAEMAAFQAGKHVFVGNGGKSATLDGSFYGWASMPETWLKNFLGNAVTSIEYRDDGSFEQAVFIVKKAPKKSFIERLFS